MCDPQKLEVIVNVAKVLYDKSMEHGIYHVERVLKWALKIVKGEDLSIDSGILKVAAYLHDIGRLVGDPHAYYSALLSEELLKEAMCSNDAIREIVLAIKVHSFSYAKNAQNANELGKVLSDADKLDALGLIGFLRVFMYSEKLGRDLASTLNHFNSKIFKLHTHMYYEYSKKVARKYIKRIRHLLKWLVEELS